MFDLKKENLFRAKYIILRINFFRGIFMYFRKSR